MKTAEEIKLKKVYLEGFVEGHEVSAYSYPEIEVLKAQIKILDWVLEESKTPVNIKCEVK